MMPLTARQGLAAALLMTLVVMPLFPLTAIADDTVQSATSTSANPTESTSAATSSVSSDTSSSGSSVAATTTDTQVSSTSASTSTDDLTIHATTSVPSLIAGSSTVAEVVTGTASSSGSGFLPTDGASTTPATSTPDLATSTPDGTATTSPAIDLSVASSTQTIVTGSSVALANILNLLNATFVNSNGSILFANLTGAAGTVDVRDGTLFSGLCGTGTCNGVQGIQINLVNDAQILNQILINANSGGNAIANASSSAAIGTGDAYAGLNLINLANVTFADSNYLILTLNAFQDVNGDIVFPALQSFLNQSTGALSNSTVNLNNTAEVNNSVGASAQSGGNTLNDIASSSAIVTGDSNARLNIFNQINSLLMGNGVSVLLRFGGPWNGEIQGLVPGVDVTRTPTSVFISGTAPGGGTSPVSLGLNATSSAYIDNQSSVNALTGNNDITNGSSTALISTGNAYAGANIINIANQTVIGRNWLFAIINVFGNFNGNIAFGRPDLWVGDSASVPSTIGNGTSITYTIRVKNKGDAPAHNAHLTELYDAAHLTVMSSSVPFETGADGSLIFALGTLAPAASVDITYEATVHDSDPGTAIRNTSTARASETDNNVADNTDSTNITASVIAAAASSGSGGGGWSGFTPAPASAPSVLAAAIPVPAVARAALSVVRTSAALTSSPGGAVTEIIQVTNTSGVVARDVVLDDVLSSSLGGVVHTEHFDIGELVPGDGVEIQYVFNFDADAPAGMYTVQSNASASNASSSVQNDGTIQLSTVENLATTTTATDTPTVVPQIQRKISAHSGGQVLGASTSSDEQVLIAPPPALDVETGSTTEENAIWNALMGFIALIIGAFGRVAYRTI